MAGPDRRKSFRAGSRTNTPVSCGLAPACLVLKTSGSTNRARNWIQRDRLRMLLNVSCVTPVNRCLLYTSPSPRD
eukprot:2186382-Alexandrium_andersonii.AAC.1